MSRRYIQVQNICNFRSNKFSRFFLWRTLYL